MNNGFTLKTLLVDNDCFSMAMYEQHLSNMGCSNVKTFDNDMDCISNIEKDTRVIFLDYRLNPEKGLQVLRDIKAMRPDIYLVFITGPSGTLEALFSLKYGAFEYIIKDENYAANLKMVLDKIQQIERMIYRRPGGNGTNYYHISE